MKRITLIITAGVLASACSDGTGPLSAARAEAQSSATTDTAKAGKVLFLNTKTQIDTVVSGCGEQIRVTGTLHFRQNAFETKSERVHNSYGIQISDATATGVTSGTTYKVRYHEQGHRNYEVGGTPQVAGNVTRMTIEGPGANDDLLLTIHWRYRQDASGQVVANVLETTYECK
jgi:hypothetical protein